MVALRLDRRLFGRVDPSDVIQEAFMEAMARREDYLREPAMPFFLWLRFLTGQKLLDVHRRHLGVKARDAGREIALHARGLARGDLRRPGRAAAGADDHARARRPSGPR